MLPRNSRVGDPCTVQCIWIWIQKYFSTWIRIRDFSPSYIIHYDKNVKHIFLNNLFFEKHFCFYSKILAPDKFWIRMAKFCINYQSSLFSFLLTYGSKSGSIFGIRIRIYKLSTYGSNLNPDPQQWEEGRLCCVLKNLFSHFVLLFWCSLKGVPPPLPFSRHEEATIYLLYSIFILYTV